MSTILKAITFSDLNTGAVDYAPGYTDESGKLITFMDDGKLIIFQTKQECLDWISANADELAKLY